MADEIDNQQIKLVWYAMKHNAICLGTFLLIVSWRHKWYTKQAMSTNSEKIVKTNRVVSVPQKTGTVSESQSFVTEFDPIFQVPGLILA